MSCFQSLFSFRDAKTLALSFNRWMPVNPSLIQFTPRSVLMALDSKPQSAKKEKKGKKEKKRASEAVENSKEIISNGGGAAAAIGKGREVLLRSIAGFLESNGFKKTLAIFQSEAQLEDNSWKSSVVDLNEFAAKWSDSSDVLSVPAIEGGKPQDDEQQQEPKEKRKNKSSKELEPVVEERQEPKQEKKDKKKKKESNPSENGNVKIEENASLGEIEPSEGKKERKKRKESENEETETGENATKKKDKEGKKSKKKESGVRKETEMEEKANEKATDKETNVEDEEKTISKKRKKEEEENGENDGKKRKLDIANGKKDNQSAEPKSANAFKRVKVEEVKFVDDRLQDNSYWAKDGADAGYGAKAQQILEQVRGRDFRHEKTKKKRGTYKGGQIDLQSHSIKFNYSDEE